MATNNINPNADPGIPVVNNAPLDPSLVASTATVNTRVDPLLNATQTLIVTTANPTAAAVTTTTNNGTLTQINIINSAVQNFLDTYQGNIGNVYHADVATFANTVPYTGVIGRPDLSVVAEANLTPTSRLMARLRNARSSCLLEDSSSRAINLGSPSMMVTLAPKEFHTEANSHPMTPPPRTITDFGT